MSHASEHEAQALSLIRDWRAYLRARRIMLGQTMSVNAFERDTDSLALEEAEADIAALGQECRRLFESAFQERRAAWQQALEAEEPNSTANIFLDQATIEQHALNECLELVEGHQHPDGLGYVRYPALAGDPITWHDAFLPQLDSIPDEAAYRLSQRHGKRREQLLRIGTGILLLPLCTLLLWTLFTPETVPVRAANEEQPDYELTAWAHTGLLIEGPQTSQTLPINGIDALPWPNDGRAHLLMGAQLPMQLCVPSETLADASRIHILSKDISPERIYTLSENSSQADMLISSCSDAEQSRQAYLSDVKATPVAKIGDKLSLAENLDITLEKVTLRGPAEDSSIPEQSMHVILTLSTVLSDSSTADWTAYAPTLALLDGSLQAAPQIHVSEQTVGLRYLVNIQHSMNVAELRLTNSAGQNIRWRFSLGMPPDRSRMLSKVLHIESLEARNTAIIVTLSNQGDSDLLLQSNDFVISQEDLPFAQQAISGIESTLAPGESRHIQISLPEEAVGELMLSIGSFRYRISEQ